MYASRISVYWNIDFFEPRVQVFVIIYVTRDLVCNTLPSNFKNYFLILLLFVFLNFACYKWHIGMLGKDGIETKWKK